jgi:hypothetical protein
MGVFTSILLSVVALLIGVEADVTFWETTTHTETAWSTTALPANTIWNTETYTETAWSTYIPPAVTVSIPYTVTSVLNKDYTDTLISTVEKDYTTTVIKTSVVISVTTVYSVQSGPTITQACTPVTIKQPTTITIPPTTVTAPPVIITTSLTGIVTCPSRTINPTYTTSTQLPDDYTWGCPPGYLCQPPQVNCNFEQNPPADTYYCSPDECVPAPPLSSFNQTGPGCGPYQTAPGYFNFNPELFGLSYSIFVDGGDYAETCLECATTTWAPVSQISDGQPQAPTLVPVCQTSNSQLQAPAHTTTWIPVSTISDGWPQRSVMTTATWLAKRQINQPLPQVCYEDCNICLDVAERDGKPKCCPADSEFSSVYGQCSYCLSAHRTDTRTAPTDLLPSLQPYLSYCNAQKNVAAPSTPLAESTISSPSTSLPPTTTAPSITTTPTAPSTSTTQISQSSSSTSSIATFSGAAGHTVSPPSLTWSSPIGWVLLLLANALQL